MHYKAGYVSEDNVSLPRFEIKIEFRRKPTFILKVRGDHVDDVMESFEHMTKVMKARLEEFKEPK